MKKQLFTIIFILSVFCFKAQTPLVTGSNMHGFTYSSGNAVIDYSNSDYLKLQMVAPFFTTAVLDTSIAVNSFDYVIVSFDVCRVGGNIDGTNMAISAFGNLYSIPDSSLGVNTISDTIFVASNFQIQATAVQNNPTIYLSNLRIVGHNVVGISDNYPDKIIVFATGRQIMVNGLIAGNQKLNIINMLGQTVFTCALQEEITTNLPSGLYSLQVLNINNKAVLSKKIFIEN